MWVLINKLYCDKTHFVSWNIEKDRPHLFSLHRHGAGGGKEGGKEEERRRKGGGTRHTPEVDDNREQQMG